MIFSTIKFKGHFCFRDHWSGFTDLKAVNVIIGRNNAGKSLLLDFVETLCADHPYQPDYMYQCVGVLDEGSLRNAFPPNTSGGALGGNHWRDHGLQLVNCGVEWEIDGNSTRITEIDQGRSLTAAREKAIGGMLRGSKHRLSGTRFCRLLADRDIRPEQESIAMALRPDGSGASNVIRRLLLSANPNLTRDLVRKDLLDALNYVFQEDGRFREIQVNVHDEPEDAELSDSWEVFLAEDKKGGLIPLSKSGSGLKTVILVLLHLIVLPKIEGSLPSRFTFAFEELENNLHPALLRRLFQFVESFAVEKGTHIFLSTHSSIALDLFGGSKNAQIVHVLHDGRSARTVDVAAHFDRVGVVAELGAKPSDLLHANGVVWVEGPSDRIYVNHWIALCSEGRLREGVHYQCAYFGGSLLARVTFDTEHTSQQNTLANLLRVNPNVLVICDSDRTRKGAHLKDRVRRIRSEVEELESGHIWITGAKEVENYIPGSVLSTIFNIHALPDPEQYMNFYPRKGSRHRAYVTAHLGGRAVDKVKLATLSVRHMARDSMALRFDWEQQMKKVVQRIDRWNV